MNLEAVGLSDLALHIPESSISLSTIVSHRISEDPSLERHLERAIRATGQKSLRFPRIWEDTATMAAQACHKLVGQHKDIKIDHVRFLTLGTETSVDMSKAGSSYVLGMMEKSGIKLPSTLSTFQVQHACAGGALSMMTVAGFIQAAGLNGDSGIVLTSDIARYLAPSTAEVTQGAGATALLVARNPKLLEFDLPTAGFFSRDVDDFFRPLGSTIAKVKGGFSVQCYNESLIAAFEDHCQRAQVNPGDELESIDLFQLHIPYAQMPVTAMYKLLAKHLGLNEEQAIAFLEKRGFFKALEPTSEVGNIYTGSLFLGLAFGLKERLAHFGPNLVGKKVMMASYGSGNTMSVILAKVAAEAPGIIGGWNLDSIKSTQIEATFEEYLRWISDVRSPETYPQELINTPPAPQHFYLKNIREDGYREYSWS